MKTRFFHTCKIAAVAASLLLTTSLDTSAAEYVSVVKDGVNVRTGPSTSNPVYMELFKGYPLKVIDKKDDWLKVQDFENDSGWIYASLIEKSNTVIVSADTRANMRSGPGTDNPVVATLERGVILNVIERQDKWFKVKHLSGTEGWIYSPLLWP
ncbi:MAG: SH3 domain-containing protein [Desulfopila sp.]|jgi:SH3-like domain-containing protein|nr:SH3 domain-containing protein [Desulfopila sp.]